MKRRAFLRNALATGTIIAAPTAWGKMSDYDWEKTWNAALMTLDGNVRHVPKFSEPVLFEGSMYRGIWQECGPHESLCYAQLTQFVKPVEGKLSPLDVAKNTHRAFFSLQREDGQLPASVKISGMNWGQIQMAVSIAATAWDVWGISKDEAFLAEAYNSCSRWDGWLRRYRNTRGSGLVEAFCSFDTGQDNSPRWAGVSDECPNHNAAVCPEGESVPRLCPDLSAAVFGARVALSSMADALGKKDEAAKWTEDAEDMRRLIIEKLWCAEDSSFYDVAPNNRFVRVVGEILMSLGHKMPEQLCDHIIYLRLVKRRE